MSETSETREQPETLETAPADVAQAASTKRGGIAIPYWAQAFIPIIVALILTGLILLALGKDPLTFYWNIIDRGDSENDSVSN